MSTSPRELVEELVIRPLSQADVPAVMEIEGRSFSTPWRHSTFRGLLLRKDTDLIGATRIGRLIGYAVCWTVGDQAELGNVAVAEAERGKGTGRRLVHEILERVRERGAEAVFLEVRVSNESARTLYEQCDFRLVGRRRNYYAKPIEDALVMRRDLI